MIRFLSLAAMLLGALSPDIATAEEPDAEMIVGGKPAKPGKFPYQVRLYESFEDEKGFCGGSIIDAEWILTAQHCVDGASASSMRQLAALRPYESSSMPSLALRSPRSASIRTRSVAGFIPSTSAQTRMSSMSDVYIAVPRSGARVSSAMRPSAVITRHWNNEKPKEGYETREFANVEFGNVVRSILDESVRKHVNVEILRQIGVDVDGPPEGTSAPVEPEPASTDSGGGGFDIF